jgi:hypothetical protein
MAAPSSLLVASIGLPPALGHFSLVKEVASLFHAQVLAFVVEISRYLGLHSRHFLCRLLSQTDFGEGVSRHHGHAHTGTDGHAQRAIEQGVVFAVPPFVFEGLFGGGHIVALSVERLIPLVADVFVHPIQENAEVPDAPTLSVWRSALCLQDGEGQVANASWIEVLAVIGHGGNC